MVAEHPDPADLDPLGMSSEQLAPTTSHLPPLHRGVASRDGDGGARGEFAEPAPSAVVHSGMSSRRKGGLKEPMNVDPQEDGSSAPERRRRCVCGVMRSILRFTFSPVNDVLMLQSENQSPLVASLFPLWTRLKTAPLREMMFSPLPCALTVVMLRTSPVAHLCPSSVKGKACGFKSTLNTLEFLMGMNGLVKFLLTPQMFRG